MKKAATKSPDNSMSSCSILATGTVLGCCELVLLFSLFNDHVAILLTLPRWAFSDEECFLNLKIFLLYFSIVQTI
jgi:hypothetical protein